MYSTYLDLERRLMLEKVIKVFGLLRANRK
jgi:hypothetical protein